MEINIDNAWDIINYYLSNEEEKFNISLKQMKIGVEELPINIDESINLIKKLNMIDWPIYKLLILKKDLLTNVGGDETPPI